jgi:hypothetical protein
MDTIGLDRANRFLRKKQHLSKDAKSDDIARITRDIGGLDSTNATAPYLSLFARSTHFKKNDLDVELSKKKTLARLRYVRGTIYVLPREFLPVAYAATSRMSGATAERYSKRLGLTPGYYRRTAGKIAKILKGRGLTAEEVRQKLRQSFNIKPILDLMCDKGLLIRGQPRDSWKSTTYTYYLFEDYYPGLDLNAYGEEEARRIVIRRHIANFGPVDEQDIAWWTGFPLSQVRKILGDLSKETISVVVRGGGQGFFLLSSDMDALNSLEQKGSSEVDILPAIDPYIKGHRNMNRYLGAAPAARLSELVGNAGSIILVDGRAAGTLGLGETAVKICMFGDVGEGVFEEVRSKAAEVGTFFSERKVPLEVSASIGRDSTGS